jgi:hypothetical protein
MMSRKHSAPTEPGWYWVRKYEHTDKASVVHVVLESRGHGPDPLRRILVVESADGYGHRGCLVADFACTCWGPKVKEPRF